MRYAGILCTAIVLGASVQVGVAQPYTSELGGGLVITVNSLKRSGMDSVVFKGSIENTGTTTENFSGCTGGDWIFRVDIQEPVAKKQYEQIKIEKNFVGSRHYTDTSLKPKEKKSIWARITAPPADVEKVTLVFSCSAPPIEDIPLQK